MSFSNEKPTMASQTTDHFSYAKATKFLNKLPFDHAIIIGRDLDKSHEDHHILALIKIASPNYFFTTDIIAKDRIIVWCKSRKIADDLVGKNILVAGQASRIRAYVNPNKRVLFTHCFSHIEDEFLLGELQKCGVKTIGPIVPLKAGFKTPSIAHYFSQRREVHIAPEDLNKVPSRIKANVLDKEMWVFFTTELSACHDCHQTGHFSKKCPHKAKPTSAILPKQPQTNLPIPLLAPVSPQVQTDTVAYSPFAQQETIPNPQTKYLANPSRRRRRQSSRTAPHPHQAPKTRTSQGPKVLKSRKRLRKRRALPSSSSSSTLETSNMFEGLEGDSDMELHIPDISGASRLTQKKKRIPKKKQKKNKHIHH